VLVSESAVGESDGRQGEPHAPGIHARQQYGFQRGCRGYWRGTLLISVQQTVLWLRQPNQPFDVGVFNRNLQTLYQAGRFVSRLLRSLAMKGLSSLVFGRLRSMLQTEDPNPPPVRPYPYPYPCLKMTVTVNSRLRRGCRQSTPTRLV
jgi:hypothetical protein